MELFLFILSFMSGGVVLTVAYTTYITTSTKTKQDKLAFMQEQLMSLQKSQFSDMEFQYKKTLDELTRIGSEMEGDSYRDLVKTNQRISKSETKLDTLIKDVNKMNVEQRGEINRISNDTQNKLIQMTKAIGNELKQNY
jgi:hypothetical protein